MVRLLIPILLIVLVWVPGPKSTFAQPSSSVLYVPIIGITSVPEPLALPNGIGGITYHYAVKNFIKEIALTDIQVVDDTCSPVKFVEGDDNNNSLLDSSETWRYTCTTTISKTTQSIATAKGTSHSITATHKAYTTVVVGSNNPAPLVSIVNITKVAYPLSLPIGGGAITFTYRVNNPGVVPLSNVIVTDNKCENISGRLGDTNANNLLDISEVWVYTCTTNLEQTTTNTVSVTAYANNLRAVGEATITVEVDTPLLESSPDFPETGDGDISKFVVWGILAGILVTLMMVTALTKRSGQKID